MTKTKETPDELSVADALRQWRLAKGWTRRQAADHFKVTVRSIENWEYGHRKPASLNLLAQLWGSRRPK